MMEAEKYPKIQTVWNRDPATKHRTLLVGEWARPEFEWLSELNWLWTEKIDGTNIRVEWKRERGVTLGGRTERAQIPAFLVEHLHTTLPEELWRDLYSDTSMCLYGEGYGAHIQKGGGNYIPDGVSFVLFDVMINGMWLKRVDVEGIAQMLNIDVVPVVGRGTLIQAIDWARRGFASQFGSAQAEGLVMRPPEELFNRRGQRVVCKIKHKDFTKEAPCSTVLE